MKFVRAMTLLGSAAILTAATGQFAPAGAVDVNLYFREGVPAPSYAPLRIVVDNGAPDYVVIPQSRGTYVRNSDHDLYRYQGTYWAYDDGYWFRGPRVNGPWTAVRVERVPRPVLYVPANYHARWVTVPVEYRVKKSIVRHEMREERREDKRHRKAVKHHTNHDND